MGAVDEGRDDRVLGYTRGLSLFIIPFLLVAFVILYVFPRTRRDSGPGRSRPR